MEENKDLLEKMRKHCKLKEKDLVFKQNPKPALTFVQLKDSLSEVGHIMEEDIEKQIFVVLIMSGIANMNPAVVSVQLSEGILWFAGYAKEGLIKQHTAEKAIAKIEEVLDKKWD